MNKATFWWLVLVLVSLPVAAHKVVFLGLPLYYPEIAVLGALVCWWLDRRERFVFPTVDRIILLGGVLLLVGATVTLFAHPFTLTGLGMLKSWFFFPALYSLLIFSECQNRERQRILVKVLLVVLTLTALQCLVSYWQGRVTYDGRLAGPYTSPNFLAFLMATGLALPLILLDDAVRWTKFSRIVLVLSPVLLMVTLLLTRSYGVILAVCLGLLAYGLWQREHSWRKSGAVLGILFALGMFMASEYGSEKWQVLFTEDPRSSWSSREMIWQAAFRIALDHPFGIGVGRFQELYLDYQQFFPPYLEWSVPEPHNVALAMFFATGPIGLFGFILLVGRTLWLLSKELRTKSAMIAGMMTYWCIFLVMGLVDTPFFKGDLAYLFFFMVTLSALAVQKELPRELT